MIHKQLASGCARTLAWNNLVLVLFFFKELFGHLIMTDYGVEKSIDIVEVNGE